MARDESSDRLTGWIEESAAFPAFLDLLAWSAAAEPRKMLNAVDVTRGDADLYAGVAIARQEGRDGQG